MKTRMLVVCLLFPLLAACGGGDEGLVFDDGGSSSTPTVAPAPAGVYTDTVLINNRAHLVVVQPTSSGYSLFWFYSPSGQQLSAGLSGFAMAIFTNTPTNVGQGNFSLSGVTDFELDGTPPGAPPSASPSANMDSGTYIGSPTLLSGNMTQDGQGPQAFSLTRQTLTSQDVSSLNRTFTGTLHSDREQTTNNVTLQLNGGSLTANVPGTPGGCSFSGSLQSTSVPSVYTLTVVTNTGGSDCAGDPSQARFGIVLIDNNSQLFMAIASAGATPATAAVFSGN